VRQCLVILAQIKQADFVSHVSRVRGYSWDRRAIDSRQFVAQGQSDVLPQQVVRWPVVELRASRLRPCPAWQAASCRTTSH
jgi:hypothetical protein